ncbi:MAG TPA: alginate lyase family protein [Terriglobales bacterium]
MQRDGLSNPDNFVAHRRALIRLSLHVPALTAAWIITKKKNYAHHAVKHLHAWFINPDTRMNPNLQYAQAIHGRSTGRSFGIIDTLHLVEVVQAITSLRVAVLSRTESEALKQWFVEYLDWMTTSNNGKEERDAKNNHGTCWVMQVAEFAKFTNNKALTAYCTDRFKTVLVPNQIAQDGSFPEELRRTKPYSYCIFNLDAMAAICQILSTTGENLWNYTLSDGRGMKKAMAFMFPYLADKASWPYPKDVQYFDNFPVRQCSLFFAGLAYSNSDYLALWRKLNPDPTVEEVIRNYPIHQPLLWLI